MWIEISIKIKLEAMFPDIRGSVSTNVKCLSAELEFAQLHEKANTCTGNRLQIHIESNDIFTHKNIHQFERITKTYTPGTYAKSEVYVNVAKYTDANIQMHKKAHTHADRRAKFHQQKVYRYSHKYTHAKTCVYIEYTE